MLYNCVISSTSALISQDYDTMSWTILRNIWISLIHCNCYLLHYVYSHEKSYSYSTLLGKWVFGSIALVRPRWEPSACIRFRPRKRTLRCMSTNETLMPLMPYEFCCAGKTLWGCAYLRHRRCQRQGSGDEGPRKAEAGAAGPRRRVRGQRRRGRSIQRGPTP
jgi:hypothetical protein